MRETFCSIDWLKVGQVLQALLTPAIGIATVVIGVLAFKIQRQQAITNRLQYRLALLEKRMRVFDETMDLIAVVIREARIELNRVIQFLQRTREHELLFGPEIKAFIDEIYRAGVDLSTRVPAGINMGDQAAIQRQTELVAWFADQSAVAREKFLKYIDFREP